jgi:hypothetical protein
MKRLLSLLLAFILSPAADAQSTRFGRLFPQLPGFTEPTQQELINLALCMQDPGDSEDNDDLPSGFTYLGQFIDHDLTLDAIPQPSDFVDPTTLTNGRTFSFDLDSVFGGGPTGSPELYEADGVHLRVQEFTDADGDLVRDLPRNEDGSAILADRRNDENQIIAQLHVAFLKFYNRLVDMGFDHKKARRKTVKYYQWVVLHDFLPHVAGQSRINSLSKCSGNDVDFGTDESADPKDDEDSGPKCGVKRGFFRGEKAAITPVEFSVAAFRFGHSIVRNSYILNETSDRISVFDADEGEDDLRGGRAISAEKLIDWGEFLPELTGPDLDGNDINVARPLDALISESLFNLPIPGAADTGSNNLAFRNMLRAHFYRMPSGQDVAEVLGERVIPADELNPTGLPVGDERCALPTTATPFAESLDEGTPLWFYLLAESHRVESGEKLGPVGGRIVTAVVLHRLLRSHPSIIRSGFIPGPPIAPSKGEFSFADFLLFAGVADG